ncbi:hypothetical protein GMDG_03655 [Pseudogymnoascus destructans 20631-21]|uniref:Secreted protein n=1 Tax=Pseudogymnoascus destructans (strain ATCC MYA-4855 / 20631-21) TaxID=658429 RepID=L8G881_PSED2|nr:hypothetical protein GMDG_03655 [Pseudogymnoascus destructans 20631-21]
MVAHIQHLSLGCLTLVHLTTGQRQHVLVSARLGKLPQEHGEACGSRKTTCHSRSVVLQDHQQLYQKHTLLKNRSSTPQDTTREKMSRTGIVSRTMPLSRQ